VGATEFMWKMVPKRKPKPFDRRKFLVEKVVTPAFDKHKIWPQSRPGFEVFDIMAVKYEVADMLLRKLDTSTINSAGKTAQTGSQKAE
jgi:hypothetical protein